MKKVIIAVLICALIAGAAAAGVHFTRKDKSDLSISAVRSDFVLADRILGEIPQNEELWRKNLSEYYGLNEEKINSIFEEPGNWLAFDIYIDVKNLSDEEAVISGVSIANNGEGGYYCSTQLDSYYYVGPGETNLVVLTVFLDSSDPSLDEARAASEVLDINLLYSAATEDPDAGIPQDKLSYAKVSY